MRLRPTGVVVSLVGLSCVAGIALADMSALYQITVETTMTPPNCRWTGLAPMTLTPSGPNINFMGSNALQLDPTGPPGNPPGPDPLCVALLPILSGSVQGTIVGNAINGTATTDAFPLFPVPFSGVTTDGGASATGTWAVSLPGNLDEANGIWSAKRGAPVPVLGSAALATLSCLLLGVGAWWMRRRSRDA